MNSLGTVPTPPLRVAEFRPETRHNILGPGLPLGTRPSAPVSVTRSRLVESSATVASRSPPGDSERL